MDKLFPTKDNENLLICVSGISCLISDSFTDLHFNGDTQCFPLNYYAENPDKAQVSLFDEDAERYIRKDGISDWIAKRACEQYGAAVKKDDIFFYVYGYLHSPAYLEKFSEDLKKSLPRIPLMDKAEDFWKISKAGRELARLHLRYEEIAPLEAVEVKGDRRKCRVTKMRFLAKDRKDTILFNDHIRVENIPATAYEYVVNGKSAIEWVIERYQIKTDKDSGIVNDPNLWCDEHHDPEYILKLLLSVIAVSVQTVEIVRGLPTVIE
jgi:predicted helicase